MVIVVMGVSGSGKTTIGKLLAEKLNLPFFDADDFHPPENVETMKKGKPLSDNDRKPWLENLAHEIKEWNSKKGAILACSALKKCYRQRLTSKSKDVQYVYLKGDMDTIFKRMKSRDDHFMPPELLNSQFEVLEEPFRAITVYINKPPEAIVREIVNHPKLLHIS